MKHMRKALALIMALAIVMSLGITAFAADPANTYTITVTNNPTDTNVSINGATYTAYKVLDVTYTGMPGDGANKPHTYTVNEKFNDFTYTVVDDSETATYKTNAEIDKTNLIAYIGEMSSNSKAIRLLADAIYAYAKEGSHNVLSASAKASDEKAKIDVTTLGAGYYVVFGTGTASDENSGSDTLTSALILNTTNPTKTVGVKIKAPTLEKKVTSDGTTGNHADVDVGDTLEFTLDSIVPRTEGFNKKYEMKFADTMTTGLTLDVNSIEVKINNKLFANTLADGATNNSAISISSSATGFTITMDMLALGKEDGTNVTEGKKVVISYKASVNDTARTTKIENNTATLEYSNNPTDATSKGKTPEKKTYVYDFNINILKYEPEDEKNPEESKKLADAQFILYKTSDNESTGTASYYKTTINKVEWDATKDNATVLTTNSNGTLATPFNGLDAGTYFLEEIKAPDGYELLKAPVKVEIIPSYKKDGTIKSVQYRIDGGELVNAAQAETGITATAAIANSHGNELPTTGGIGTTIFYTVGALMMVSALVLLITKKKMSV